MLRFSSLFVRNASSNSFSMPRILITGANGQLGGELAEALRGRFGPDAVLCTDIRVPAPSVQSSGAYFRYLDCTNKDDFARLVVEHRITHIVHYAALLSAIGERNPKEALHLNMRGTEVALEVAQNYGSVIMIPSSIAAFGPTTPRMNTPNITIQRPNTIYGVSKVYAELLGEYYHKRFGVDFRCVRYPGIISWKSAPGGGTTDWSNHAFFAACEPQSAYTCFVRPDTKMPLMYVPDCIKGTIDLMLADEKKLSCRTYNLNALSFSPDDLARAIRRHVPHFKIDYAPDMRQAIADSWPVSLDDADARRDWGWQPQYSLEALTADMLQNIMAQRAGKK
ncbi:mitochondrial L-threonine 3-dehydrogenase [Andalucia godoyi]|uniref:L-threonine 3-dehydrogenase, mitochondrial n=1 Tax=Andalucia godoyi TaxID=505711 RepID=A0A8K0AI03_ANDGO|nr:mitochondrial L-threonine 3-dehydrogenase [Andalucia godoyi]|eukprot:ANDGO_08515.mRNA.1 mitochondrial L-threonine 3-dehydrogenase